MQKILKVSKVFLNIFIQLYQLTQQGIDHWNAVVDVYKIESENCATELKVSFSYI